MGKGVYLQPKDSTDKSIFAKQAHMKRNPGTGPPPVDAKRELQEEAHEEMRLLREDKRRRYRKSLFMFAKYGLGYPDLDPVVHGPLCDLLQNLYWGLNRPAHIPAMGIRKALVLMGRGMLKSTITTIAFPQWVLLQNDPPAVLREAPPGRKPWEPPPSFNGRRGHDQRILINNLILKNAKEWLATIKRSFEQSEELRDVFGSIAHERRIDGLWTAEAANVAWRSNHNERDPNLSVSSIDHSVNSGHYDIGLYDDMIDESMVNNPEQIEASIKYHQLQTPLLWRPSLMIYVGVLWDDKDLYDHLMNSEEERGQFEIYKLPAERSEEEVEKGARRAVFPAKMPEEVLDQNLRALGARAYSCQYLLDPIPQKDAAFKADYFVGQRYRLEDIQELETWLRTLNIITTCDPAITKDKRGCKAVITTWGWDPRGRAWILDLFAKKGVQPAEFLEEIFRQGSFWKSASVGIESNGFQELYSWNIDRMFEEKKTYLPVIELKPAGRLKDVRIARLEPLCRAKKLFFRSEHVDFEKEAIRWPHGKSKDVLDASAYQLDLAYPGSEPEEEPVDIDLNTFEYEKEHFRTRMLQREEELKNGRWRERRRRA